MKLTLYHLFNLKLKRLLKGWNMLITQTIKKHAKELFVLYLCSNFQHSFLAGHADEIIDQEHLCMKSESEWNSEKIKSFIKYKKDFLFIYFLLLN